MLDSADSRQSFLSVRATWPTGGRGGRARASERVIFSCWTSSGGMARVWRSPRARRAAAARCSPSLAVPGQKVDLAEVIRISGHIRQEPLSMRLTPWCRRWSRLKNAAPRLLDGFSFSAPPGHRTLRRSFTSGAEHARGVGAPRVYRTDARGGTPAALRLVQRLAHYYTAVRALWIGAIALPGTSLALPIFWWVRPGV